MLVRFTNILQQQLDRLCDAFDTAIATARYGAAYTAIYPIKVNQQRPVIDTLVQHGGERIGLEAGSKAELLAVIGVSPPGGRIICNGYKDTAYLRLALLAQRLGHRVVIVIEKTSELALIDKLSRELSLRPCLGVRVRLSAVTRGHWQNSGGDRAKFGFSATGLLRLIEQMRHSGLDDCLQLLHCHPGSQISRLATLQSSLQEVARTWAALRQAGLPVSQVNVGGGLGVDYEGRSADRACSMDYDMAAYASAVVSCFAQVCDEQGLDAPALMSESGRALTAHHAVLLTQVIDSERVSMDIDDYTVVATPAFTQLQQAIDACRPVDACTLYARANAELEQVRGQFARGEITLAQRASGESHYYRLCRMLSTLMQQLPQPPPELDTIQRTLADKYYCNLSIFQSMPDVWGIGQLFPVVPLQRLDELPARRAIVHDLTCDSDGHIEHYVDATGIESSLPVHELYDGETCLLGFFLLGAYQEILGDMHNLFGDTDAINVTLGTDGGLQLQEHRHGDSVDVLLRYVDMQPQRLLASYRDKMVTAGMNEQQTDAYTQLLETILKGTTYLDSACELYMHRIKKHSGEE